MSRSVLLTSPSWNASATRMPRATITLTQSLIRRRYGSSSAGPKVRPRQSPRCSQRCFSAAGAASSFAWTATRGVFHFRRALVGQRKQRGVGDQLDVQVIRYGVGELREPPHRLLAVAGGRVRRVHVELRDDLVPEHLEHLEDLVVEHSLAGQAEHDLVATDVLVAHDLLAHLVGRPA